jgi:hypothetical protein
MHARAGPGTTVDGGRGLASFAASLTGLLGLSDRDDCIIARDYLTMNVEGCQVCGKKVSNSSLKKSE